MPLPASEWLNESNPPAARESRRIRLVNGIRPVKRRVAFFSVVPSPYQRDLFAALASRSDIELAVFYLEPASPDSPWPEKSLAPYEKILRGFWLSVRGARVHVNWGIPSLNQYDLVVVNTLMSITGQRLMRFQLRERPWIFMGEKLSPPGRPWHERLSAPLHQASAIAAVGTWAQCDYARRFPEPRSYSLPYCCNLDPFLVLPRHQSGTEIVFLFCGQMIWRKGVELLISAFNRIEGARLLLIGREAELPSLLSPLHPRVRSRIEYLGFQAPEDLPRYFAKADVFVLPSRYDGWGVVVNQAVAAGLPVICSDQVGAGFDLVEDGVNGLKFPTGDEAELKNTMLRFIEHPEIIQPWGEESRAKAQTWTPAIAAEKWSKAIDEVLQS
jgi:glycosyltransferase involved in cell wall biosynthesis